MNIYDDYAKIDDNVRVADSAKIGYYAKIDDNVRVADNVRIADSAKIGYWAKIGDNATIGDNVRIADWAKIGDNATIGDNVRIGDFAEIGDCAKIGDYAEIGDWAKIGDNVRIGSKFRCECLEVIDFFTMANVDGTGRRIHIYVHTEGIAVRAGCFIDTLDEFCWKAEQEEKYLYSVTVRAAAEAFADEVHRQGKTGGWDK